MSNCKLPWACAAALIGLLSACNIDDRFLTSSTRANQPGADASVNGSTPEVGNGDGDGDGLRVGVLGVEPPSFDFGPSVIGAPSRTRVAVLNSGDGALAAAGAALAAGSAPDYLVLLNQCENGVAPAGRCDIRLQFVASKAGPSAATLGVESSGQSAQVALAGSGVAPGPLTLAPSAGSSADFGGVVLAASEQMSFDVSNPTLGSSGPLVISVNDAQFQLLPPAQGDCQSGATVLVNGQRCRIRVAFTPTRRGPLEASLVVNSTLGASSLPLAGIGNSPAALDAPSTVDFGGVVLGGTALRTLRIGNAGDEPLVMAGMALAGSATATLAPAVPAAGDAGGIAPAQGSAPGGVDAFSIQNSDCGAGMVLAGGQACTLTLGFRPLAAAANQQTQLVVSAANGTASQIALNGSGLSQGALVVAMAGGGTATFGELLVGQSQTLQFTVTNPTAQLSGPLQFFTSDDFATVPPAVAGDCESGVTSLVNGASCSFSVNFTPRERGQRNGSLLVSSALAGSVHQPLTGRGVAPALLALPRTELDFGRVPAETPVQQTLSIVNEGDQPVATLQATLEAPGGGPAQGFTVLGACAGGIAPRAPCQLGIEFMPPAANAYAAVLRVAGDTGSAASALLLGRAFPRGSLVLTAATGSTDFGDVVLGSSRSLDFTLANPGSVASGRLTLATSSNAFTLSEGDCNPEGSAGLIDGSSCTFSVTFTPTTSDALSVSLSVQSPGAGETALSLTGRGRTAASLTATGNRDFGSANVNEQGLTDPTNQFTWTVTNDGDLGTGALAIDNTNAAEFIVSNDACSNVSVPGHGTCTMDIRFLPGAAGTRSASLTVTDTVSSEARVLAMTGNGVVIAGPGESCVSAGGCSDGFTCTGGVCCDRECVGSCLACSSTGVCTNQAERQPCGDGSGVCFGVNQCLLPEREACSGDDQCGSRNCERRLGGQGPADLICCLDDCGATGQQCNPQTGRCQVPALGVDEACGAAGQPACAAGLACKPCLAGGSQCTPPDGCCGGCPGEQVCTGGACACPTPPGALQQIHCGSGRCIPNVAGACCDTATGCDGDLQCNAATNLCACPAGSRECTAGSGDCLSNAQCCNCGGPCNQCVNGQCLPIGNGQAGGCTGGQACQGGSCACPQGQTLVNGQCVLPQGAACQVNGTPCATGQCVDGVCCESLCQGVCTQCQAGTGRCIAPPDDAACSPVACDTGNACQLSAPIQNNRCLAPGQCKTAADCSRQPAPARTPCGPAETIPGLTDLVPVCNAAGTCNAPAVNCRGVTETITPTNCCSLDFPESLDPVGFVPVCDPGASGNITAVCDSVNDCPLGSVCCLNDGGNFNYITCETSCAESGTPGDPTGTGVYLVCSSPGGGTSPCPGGRACNRAHPELAGWTFCSLP